MPKMTHIDASGKARMVDIGNKAVTERMALARGEVRLKKETLQSIKNELIKKGDVFAVAEIAGIMAAKKTAEIIPLCHPLLVNQIEVDLEINDSSSAVIITAKAKTSGKTGVEMEALTAVSVAALTVYDMVKAIDRTGVIQNIRLLEKHGGQSGDVYNP
jgi:cyclic pyranopterin phosphate synthase